MTSRLAGIALIVGCVAFGFTAAQPAGAPRGQARASMPVTITMPDTMKVSVREPVPINARLGETVTVRIADRWWDSNWFGAFLSAAVVLLAVFLAQWRKDAADDARMRARLLTRTREALEAAEMTLRTVLELKPDGTKEFDLQTMNGLIHEHRTRVALRDGCAAVGRSRHVTAELLSCGFPNICSEFPAGDGPLQDGR